MVVLFGLEYIFPTKFDVHILISLRNLAEKNQDIQIGIGEDDIPCREKLQEQFILTIAKTDLNDTICTNLRDTGDPSTLEVFS